MSNNTNNLALSSSQKDKLEARPLRTSGQVDNQPRTPLSTSSSAKSAAEKSAAPTMAYSASKLRTSNSAIVESSTAPQSPPKPAVSEPQRPLTKPERISQLLCDIFLLIAKQGTDQNVPSLATSGSNAGRHYFRVLMEENNHLVRADMIDDVLMAYMDLLKEKHDETASFLFLLRLFHRTCAPHLTPKKENANSNTTASSTTAGCAEETLSTEEQKGLLDLCRRSIVSFAGLNLMDWANEAASSLYDPEVRTD